MTREIKKRTYESPFAVDLSSLSVNGQDSTLAICQEGHSPIAYTCADGGNPTQEPSCSPNGLLPTYGRCSQGGNAVEGCFAGSSVADCVSGAAFT